MPCIKTGCVVYLEQYGEWIYGDAFDHNDVLIVRVCFKTREKTALMQFGNVRHFTVHGVAEWWDEKHSNMQQNSTLIAEIDDWMNHGYDGIQDPLLEPLESTASALDDGPTAA